MNRATTGYSYWMDRHEMFGQHSWSSKDLCDMICNILYGCSWFPDNEIYSLWYSPDFSSLVQWNMSTATTWIVTFYSDVHDSQTMNPIYFGNPQNFLLTPPWGSHLWFRMKYVKNSWMCCQKICNRYLFPHQNCTIFWYRWLIERIIDRFIEK